MSDLIDRAALLEKIDKKFFATCPLGDEQLGYLNSRTLIRTAPAVDAVEVVRCKDCKYWRKSVCFLSGFMCSGENFCSLGERKET